MNRCHFSKSREKGEKHRLCKMKKTRMTTFIKEMLKKLDDQTKIYKYRVAANMTEYHIVPKLILLRIITSKYIDKATISYENVCENVKN